MFKFQDHQIEASENILTELYAIGKTQLIAACGTGKTLIAKKVAFELVKEKEYSLVIIFMPSLALISQFNEAWNKKHPDIEFNEVPFIFCSDNKSLDEEQKKISGIDKKKLSEFLKNINIKHKVVLSTYQSSQTLCDFLRYSNFKVDFAVFDEAHKTVGLKSKEFAYAVHDRNIFIKNRLFMTATRIVTNETDYLKKLSRKEDLKLMDDIYTYGRVAYNLSMKEAIKRNIIKNFKIIIGIIDNEFMKDFNDLKEHDDFYKNILASSYIKALKSKNIKKSIIFNSRIKESIDLVNLEIIKSSLINKIEHIDGDTDYQRRNEIIEKLRQESEYHVSNARLFTEGVDVPCVNMVGLFTPTRSVVDIIQRLGRMQRKENINDNEPGYIFLPIFVNELSYENCHDLYTKFNWDYVVNVLSYLQDSNAVFSI